MNFKIVNVKNSKMEFKKQLKYGLSTQWDAYNKLTQRDIIEALWKKTRWN